MLLFRLPVEYLDELHGREIFGEIGIQGRDLGPGDPVGGAIQLCKKPGEYKDKRN